MDQELDKIAIPAGTVIHFRGMPFRLADDTVVLGRIENHDVALRGMESGVGGIASGEIHASRPIAGLPEREVK